MVSEGFGKGHVVLRDEFKVCCAFLMFSPYYIQHCARNIRLISPIFANCLRNGGECTSTFVGRGQDSDGIMIIRGSPDRYSLPKRDEPYQKGTHAA